MGKPGAPAGAAPERSQRRLFGTDGVRGRAGETGDLDPTDPVVASLCRRLSELTGMEGEIITLQDLFLFDHSLGLDEQGPDLREL